MPGQKRKIQVEKVDEDMKRKVEEMQQALFYKIAEVTRLVLLYNENSNTQEWIESMKECYDEFEEYCKDE